MACNLPVVSTDTGDVREVITDVAGCHIVDATADSVAKGVLASLAFGQRSDGRSHVERFSLSRIAGIMVDTYEQVLGQRIASEAA